MATTKAFELAQLSALTTVDASGNVTTNTSQIANASGDLTLDSAADIVLNADGADIILADDTVDFGRFKRDNGHLVIKSETIDKSVIIKGTTTSNAVVTALTFDMANSGRATFSENVIIAGTLTGVTDFNSSGDMSVGGDLTVTGDLTVEGTQVSLNTTALDVEDKNITLNYHASNDTSASADGAGITIQDAVDGTTDASILWGATYDEFSISHPIVVSNAIYSNGSSPRVQLQDTDGTNQFSFFQQSTSQLSLRLRNDASDGSFLVAGYGGSATTNRFLIGSTGDISFYENNGGTPQVGMHWDYADGYLGIGTDAPNNTLHVKGPNQSGYGTMTIEGDGDEVDPRLSFYGFSTTASTTRDYVLDIFGDVSEKGARYDVPTGYYQSWTIQGSKKMLLDEDGNLGIGTTDPNALLDLQGVTASSSPILRFTGTGNASQGDVIGQIEFYNSDATDNTAGIMGKIRAVAGPSGGEGSLQFLVDMPSEGADAATVALHLNGNGNVGIGTDSPDGTFHANITLTPSSVTVNETGDYNDMFIIGANASSGLGDRIPLVFNVGATDAPHISSVIEAGRYGAGWDTYLAFMTNGITSGSEGVDAIQEVMRIDKTGVGIGTDSPNQSLVVDHIGHGVGFGYVSSIPDAPGGVYSTAGGSTYPFNEYGNLILKTRTDYNVYDIIMMTASTNGVPEIRMVIKDNGRVGVGGITDPVQDFEVEGSIGTRQVRHSIRPTLNLDFANSKQLDTRITFQRDSIASYYDSNGIIRYAQVNEPRFDHDPATGESKGLLIEEIQTNLNNKSDDMMRSWALASVNVYQNAGIAPDGTHSADLVIASSQSSARHFLYKGCAINNAGNTYVFSAYIKPYNNPTQNFRFGYRVDSDTQPGDQYLTTTVIEDNLPNGWQRVSASVTVGANPSQGLVQMIIGPTNGYSPSKVEGYYIWGYQVETNGGSVATSYVRTETRFRGRSSRATYYDKDGILRIAPINTPRYSYRHDGSTWVETGLLNEDDSINYATRTTHRFSSGFTHGNYNVAPEDFTTETLAPDGTYSAAKMVPTSTSAFNYSTTYSDQTAFTNGTIVVQSVYAKEGTTPYLWMSMSGTGEPNATFNLSNGVVERTSGLLDAGTYKVANGWWRCWIRGLQAGSPATSAITFSIASTTSNRTAASGDYLYLWGKQMETNDLSSHIPNANMTGTITRSEDLAYATTHTREKDAVFIDDMQYSDWYNKDEGTYYLDMTNNSPDQDIVILGQAGYPWILYKYASAQYKTYNGNDAIVYPANNVDTFKVAISFGKTSGSSSQNGTALLTNTSDLTQGVALRNMNTLDIGYGNNSGTNTFTGTIKKLSYYPTELSSAELTALTENN